MSNFKFELGQRVLLPGERDVQGIVSARFEYLNQPNEYHVHWMQADMKLAHLLVSESILLAAQPIVFTGTGESVRPASISKRRRPSSRKRRL